MQFTGFKKGKNLNKVGMKAHDTAELFFEDVRLPESAILGGLNKGFYQLMTELPQVITDDLFMYIFLLSSLSRVLISFRDNFERNIKSTWLLFKIILHLGTTCIGC